jgi:hypothetical protein
MRITDQYFWNIVFTIFFLGFVFMGNVILESESYRTFDALNVYDYLIMILAAFRLTRLVVYDKITAFFREQFYDVVESRAGYTLEKPSHGPRRTLADLLSCPWCFGVWAGATVSFFYLLTPYAFYPILILAISAPATLMQLTANMIGWKAEQLKRDVEEGEG